MSRLSINIIYPQHVYYAVYTQELSSPTADSVDYLCLFPIWFQRSNLCSFAASDIILATCFFRTFASIFFKAIGL